LIYFCIPALNEERTVGVVLWKLRQVMTELQRDFQIIVVDDASTDATQEVLGPYTRVLPLTLIRNQKQLGYAASLEIAIREAVRRSPYPKRDALVTLQADFTEDPDCAGALVKRIEAGADLVSATPAFDENVPPAMRRARKLFRWLVKGREWSEQGDPFCGLRAFRVMTIKRAIEARGTARLLTWEGLAANAELLAQTMPHSRRNDIIETPLHYKRLQRASRFKFLPMLKQVMGIRSGKPGKAGPVELPESTIVVPAALAVELATGHHRNEQRKRHESGPRTRTRSGGGTSRGPRRDEGNARRPDGENQKRQPRRNAEAPKREEAPRERGPRPPRPPRAPRTPPLAAVEEQTEMPLQASGIEEMNAAAGAPAPEREKRRRRPRRRGRKPRTQQNGETASVEASENATEPAVEMATAGDVAEGESAPRKKSRRGRRGGRGRRRGPRTNAEGQINDNNGESAPEQTAGEL
jgi:hypothetical protein